MSDKIYYPLSHKIFYGIFLNLVLLGGVLDFVNEGFIRTDRDYSIWIKAILGFQILFCTFFFLFNLRYSLKEYGKVFYLENEAIRYFDGKEEFIFRIENVISYCYLRTGLIQIELNNLSEIEVDRDMKNFDLFMDLLIENEHINLLKKAKS